MIKRKAEKSGDGTHYLDHDFAHGNGEVHTWGYGDKDIDPADQQELKEMIN
jgi:hypothetical protein